MFIFHLDYEYVSKVLEKQEIIHTETFTTQARLLDIFAHQLYKKLKPSEIVPELYARKVLNKEFYDAILLDERNNSESSATIILIDNIWRCKRDWLYIFLDVLCNHQYEELVRVIDDSFLESKLNSNIFVNDMNSRIISWFGGGGNGKYRNVILSYKFSSMPFR